MAGSLIYSYLLHLAKEKQSCGKLPPPSALSCLLPKAHPYGKREQSTRLSYMIAVIQPAATACVYSGMPVNAHSIRSTSSRITRIAC